MRNQSQHSSISQSRNARQPYRFPKAGKRKSRGHCRIHTFQAIAPPIYCRLTYSPLAYSFYTSPNKTRFFIQFSHIHILIALLWRYSQVASQYYVLLVKFNSVISVLCEYSTNEHTFYVLTINTRVRRRPSLFLCICVCVCSIEYRTFAGTFA